MGRRMRFDKQAAVNTAMQHFWQHGYGNTGVAALVDAIGIKPSSLYAAFGSKQALFYLALDHYAELSLSDFKTRLDSNRDPVGAIEQLMRHVANGRDKRGCLLVNSLLEVGREDKAVSRHIQQHLDDVELALKTHIDKAIEDGALAEHINSAACAACLITLLWGLRVLRQTPKRAEKLDAVLEQVGALLPKGRR